MLEEHKMAIYQDYGFSPFEDKRFKDRLLDMIDKRDLRRQGGYMGGPTAGPFGMMSGMAPTAQDIQAFTNREESRAKYGKYGYDEGSGMLDFLKRLYGKDIKKKPKSQTAIKPPGAEDWSGWNLY